MCNKKTTCTSVSTVLQHLDPTALGWWLRDTAVQEDLDAFVPMDGIRWEAEELDGFILRLCGQLCLVSRRPGFCLLSWLRCDTMTAARPSPLCLGPKRHL